MLFLPLLCLAQIGAGGACPQGSSPKEQSTLEAREAWCETADGVRHGPRRAWHSNGTPWFDGEYRLGKREGSWTFWYPSGGVMTTATYKEDKADGLVVRRYESGEQHLVGACKNGVEQGRWTRFWPNGKPEIVATFENGKVAGPAQYGSRRGQPVDLEHYASEKAPGERSGAPRFNKAVADARPDAVFTECRN